MVRMLVSVPNKSLSRLKGCGCVWYTGNHMKNTWVILGIVVVVLFGGAVWLSGASAEKSNEGVEVRAHIKGNPDATVTLVEYSDFQCPACASFQPALDELMATYGDRLQLEFKHFPLLRIHPYAMQAAMAAEAAGQQGKFFEYHDLLFANQQEWSAAAVPAALFNKYAAEIGLDLDLFKTHLKSSVLRERVEADFAAGEAQGVTGTPNFFLNGQKMQFRSFEEFVAQITLAVDPTLLDNASTTPSGEGAGVRFGL